jgi:lipoprotein
VKLKAAAERGCGCAVPVAASACGTEKQTLKVSEFQSRYIVSSKIEREIISR